MDNKLAKIIKKIDIDTKYQDELCNAILYDFNVN